MQKRILDIVIMLVILTGPFFVSNPIEALAQNSEAKENLPFRNPFISPFPKRQIKVAEPITAIIEAPVEIIPPALTINGLIWNTGKPQAIVNNQVVGIGDTVAETKILNIQKSGIEILYNDKAFFIKMNDKGK